MSSDPSSRISGSRLLVFHGVLIGVGVGLLLSLFGTMMLSSMARGAGEGALGVLVFIPIIFVVFLVGGGIAGGRWAHGKRASAGSPVAIAISAYAILGVVVGAVVLLLWTNHKRGEPFRVERQSAQALWDQTYGAKYPKGEESLNALLGPLRYPKGRLLDWSDIRRPASIGAAGWEIVLETDEDLGQVVDYYMSALPEGLSVVSSVVSSPSEFYSGKLESEDGRTSELWIEQSGQAVRIRFETSRFVAKMPPDSGPEALPEAWPEPRAAWMAKVAEHSAAREEKCTAFLGELRYPGAQLVCANNTDVSRCVFVTQAAPADVIAYLESKTGRAARGPNKNLIDGRIGEQSIMIHVFPAEGPVSLGGVIIHYGR